ncbi:hypothetical protein [Yunchengibacter salinarum]|uniref:hypothetical protein n=1 Tax=Yunchengibacter salinarum TaxID=3133399 RepID=UPI0035B68B30
MRTIETGHQCPDTATPQRVRASALMALRRHSPARPRKIIAPERTQRRRLDRLGLTGTLSHPGPLDGHMRLLPLAALLPGDTSDPVPPDPLAQGLRDARAMAEQGGARLLLPSHLIARGLLPPDPATLQGSGADLFIDPARLPALLAAKPDDDPAPVLVFDGGYDDRAALYDAHLLSALPDHVALHTAFTALGACLGPVLDATPHTASALLISAGLYRCLDRVTLDQLMITHGLTLLVAPDDDARLTEGLIAFCRDGTPMPDHTQSPVKHGALVPRGRLDAVLGYLPGAALDLPESEWDRQARTRFAIDDLTGKETGAQTGEQRGAGPASPPPATSGPPCTPVNGCHLTCDRPPPARTTPIMARTRTVTVPRAWLTDGHPDLMAEITQAANDIAVRGGRPGGLTATLIAPDTGGKGDGSAPSLLALLKARLTAYLDGQGLPLMALEERTAPTLAPTDTASLTFTLCGQAGRPPGGRTDQSEPRALVLVGSLGGLGARSLMDQAVDESAPRPHSLVHQSLAPFISGLGDLTPKVLLGHCQGGLRAGLRRLLQAGLETGGLTVRETALPVADTTRALIARLNLDILELDSLSCMILAVPEPLADTVCDRLANIDHAEGARPLVISRIGSAAPAPDPTAIPADSLPLYLMARTGGWRHENLARTTPLTAAAHCPRRSGQAHRPVSGSVSAG